MDAQQAVGIVIQLIATQHANPEQNLMPGIRAAVEGEPDPAATAALLANMSVQIAARVLGTMTRDVVEAFLEDLARVAETIDG